MFKFTEELQFRLEELSEKKKAGLRTREEDAELAGIRVLICNFFNCKSAIAQEKLDGA
ncbi:MAG: hypothetical protein V7K89_14130 [Nostoc sp.]|uniref:hypothetical protein n=1 Tax=Nostoc sp. TaxID=1180 RepID=UPI002FFC61F1